MFRSKALRPIAGVVLVTFTALTLQPLTAAAQLPSAPKRPQTASTSGEERYSRLLNEIHEILKEVVPQAAMPHRPKAAAPAAPGKPGEKVLQAVGPKLRLESERAKPLPGVDVTAKVKTLRGKYKELKSLEAEVTKGFKETEKHIRDKNLPAEILARHEATVAEYERRKAEFTSLMAAVEAADDSKGSLAGALSSLGEFMAKYPNAKTHTPTDPNNLPWSSPKPVTRAPYTSPAQFKTSRLFGEPVKVAQAGSLSGISLPTTILPNTPTPADTAATEDVQITQAIRDLAASLGNAPVPIYNWVRNNIAFIPSYGSIQGSDMTLQTKRGNAFDTASLLIALLRAANVPARYVYGTIEVPVDKAMNWVGGVTVPQAAQNLMGQGGIPNIGVASGGQIRSIRLEHVWVEAFVDYVPSRGAVNRNPNTWVSLDASFKQYHFTQGMDIKTNVPFDAQSLIAQIQQGAIVNDTEGSIQNADLTRVQQTITDYQTQITSYINTQNPNATVGDVLGTQTIIPESRPILLGTLPYARVATGAKFQAIPDNLRHTLTFSLYASTVDVGLDTPALTFTQGLPTAAGKKIAIVYEGASSADQAVIADAANNFRPSLPAYLIQVRPMLKVEGVNAASGSASAMGVPQIMTVKVRAPWYEHDSNYALTSGDLAVFALNPAGITSEVYSARTRANKLSSSGHPDFIAEMFYQIVLAWWAEKYALNDAVSGVNKVIQYQLPSHALAGAPVTVSYFFGIARSAKYGSRVLDGKEDAIIAVHQAGDAAARRQTMLVLGRMGSYLESGVYDQAFLSEKGLSVSAMTALGIANATGLKIYTIDQANASMLDRISTAPDDLDDMRNAIAVGRRVTVPERDMTIGNFTGLGYIIEDSETGAAAYLISGGRNGNNSLAQENAYPLPRIPATGVHTFLIGFAQRSSPVGQSMPMIVAESSIVGVAMPTPAPIGAAAAIIAFLILLLILLKMLRDLLDKTNPRFESQLVLRHYTGSRYVPNPFVARGYILGSNEGLLGPGVYLTPDTSFWVPPGPPLRGDPGLLSPGQSREPAGCPVSPGLSGTLGFTNGVLTLLDPGSIQYYLNLATAWAEDGKPRVNDAWIELRFSRQPIDTDTRPNPQTAIEWVFKRPRLVVPPATVPLPILLLEEADSFEFCTQ